MFSRAVIASKPVRYFAGTCSGFSTRLRAFWTSASVRCGAGGWLAYQFTTFYYVPKGGVVTGPLGEAL
jgi:hypothetical protein